SARASASAPDARSRSRAPQDFVDELARVGAHDRAGRTRRDAGRVLALADRFGEAHARVALHGLLLLAVAVRIGRRFPEQEPPQHALRTIRLERGHLDHAVRAVARAVPAADAVVAHVDLAVRIALERIGRAVVHALRVLAVLARVRDVELRAARALEGRTGLAV